MPRAAVRQIKVTRYVLVPSLHYFECCRLNGGDVVACQSQPNHALYDTSFTSFLVPRAVVIGQLTGWKTNGPRHSQPTSNSSTSLPNMPSLPDFSSFPSFPGT